MPRIPTYVAEKTLDTAPQTMPRLETPRVGQAIANLGEAVQSFAQREIERRNSLEDFITDQKFQQFAAQREQALDTARQNAPEGGIGLAENYDKENAAVSQEWLQNNVPDRLRERYGARLQTFTTKAFNKATDYEVAARNDYWKTGITNQAGLYGSEIERDPDVFFQAREKLWGDIDKSSLPASEKAALKSRHGLTLAQAAADGYVKAGRYDDARAVTQSYAGFGRAEGPAPVMGADAKMVRDRITEIASQNGIDPQLAIAIGMLESGLNPNARPKPTEGNPNPTASGIFQLRNKEKRQYGIDDNATPDQQITAGLMIIKQRTDELEKAGIPVTPATVYMAHFQGTAGAKAILKADPNTPLSEVLENVGEKPGHAARVMSGNKLPADMTTGQFVQTITRRVNGALTAAGSTEIGFNERRALVDRTETLIRADEARKERESKQAQLETANLVQNDLQSILATGKEIPELSEKRVADHLGEEKARQWLQQREGARRLHETTKDFNAIPSDQIRDRVASLAADRDAAGGTGRFTNADSVYQEAKKKGDAVIKLRLDDPARAVEDDPYVKLALQKYNPADSNTVQDLVTTRIEAQKKIGIPANAVSPVTAAEAQQMAQVLIEANDTNRSQIVNRLVAETAQKYGKHTDLVLTQVVGQYIKDRDTSSMMAGALKKLAGGGRPTRSEAVTLNKAIEADQSAQSMRGQTWWGGGQGADPDSVDMLAGGGGRPSTPAQPQNEIDKHRAAYPGRKPMDAGDLQRLILNPELAKAIDDRYGEGTAQWALKARELVRKSRAPQETKAGG